jgi:pyroglutamyl-peptidase
MAPTILITGFGPFPGAPFNPTGPLVRRLARMRRPAWAAAKIITHIFPTSYAAVDRELPKLLARYRPDVLLMFGLATRARRLRIETRARNALALLPDAGGASLRRGAIALRSPAALAMRMPGRRLLAAVRTARVPAALSRDAGRYLCNYLCWRASEAAGKKGGPRLTVFVHVPKIARFARPRSQRRALTLADLTRAGASLLAAVSGARHV